jgi:Domain of unknown function (DUF4352)
MQRAIVQLLGVSVACWLLACGSSDDSAESTTTEPAGKAPGPEPIVFGKVGDSLRTQDDYEQNGKPVEEALRISVEEVDHDAAAPEGAEFSPTEAEQWVRVLVRMTQQGGSSGTIVEEQFSLTDADEQAHDPDGFAKYEPSLGTNGNEIDLAPGETRQGYLAFGLPSTTKPRDVRFEDAGFGPEPDVAVWTIE